MNDYVWMAKAMHEQGRPQTMEALMHFFGRTPIMALNGARPMDLTLEAFWAR